MRKPRETSYAHAAFLLVGLILMGCSNPNRSPDLALLAGYEADLRVGKFFIEGAPRDLIGELVTAATKSGSIERSQVDAAIANPTEVVAGSSSPEVLVGAQKMDGACRDYRPGLPDAFWRQFCREDLRFFGVVFSGIPAAQRGGKAPDFMSTGASEYQFSANDLADIVSSDGATGCLNDVSHQTIRSYRSHLTPGGAVLACSWEDGLLILRVSERRFLEIGKTDSVSVYFFEGDQ